MSDQEFERMTPHQRNIMRYYFRQKCLGLLLIVIGVISIIVTLFGSDMGDLLLISAIMTASGFGLFRSRKPIFYC